MPCGHARARGVVPNLHARRAVSSNAPRPRPCMGVVPNLPGPAPLTLLSRPPGPHFQ